LLATAGTSPRSIDTRKSYSHTVEPNDLIFGNLKPLRPYWLPSRRFVRSQKIVAEGSGPKSATSRWQDLLNSLDQVVLERASVGQSDAEPSLGARDEGLVHVTSVELGPPDRGA
jgi:hypothetical protein